MQDAGYFKEVDDAHTFAKYAKKHAKNWMAFLRKLDLDLDTASDDKMLILVRGFVKTTGWKIGTFRASGKAYAANVHAHAGSALNARVSLSRLQCKAGEPQWRSGPATPSVRSLVGLKKFDQCVFVLGVKCERVPVLKTVAVNVIP